MQRERQALNWQCQQSQLIVVTHIFSNLYPALYWILFVLIVWTCHMSYEFKNMNSIQFSVLFISSQIRKISEDEIFCWNEDEVKLCRTYKTSSLENVFAHHEIAMVVLYLTLVIHKIYIIIVCEFLISVKGVLVLDIVDFSKLILNLPPCRRTPLP